MTAPIIQRVSAVWRWRAPIHSITDSASRHIPNLDAVMNQIRGRIRAAYLDAQTLRTRSTFYTSKSEDCLRRYKLLQSPSKGFFQLLREDDGKADERNSSFPVEVSYVVILRGWGWTVYSFMVFLALNLNVCQEQDWMSIVSQDYG